MAELLSPRTRVVLAGVVLVLGSLLVVVRGPVVLQAAAAVAVALSLIALAPTVLRSDHVDWAWFPRRGDELPPEPGIATLQRTLRPEARDTGAPQRLHDIVTRIAQDRDPRGEVGPGPLTSFLSAPPQPRSLDEVEVLVAALEALSPTTTRRANTPVSAAATPPSGSKETP